ncbi:MAG: hypothetical protein LBL90_06955 [Prevotellaceae bacterium]|jgi:hypothetical protein|nr:hypothetical protein [Prevotellaceae bacterium]
MELIIQILMLFIVINCVLKLSFWRFWQVAIFSLTCAVFVIIACNYTILQSKTQLADYFNNTKIMQDVAVLVTIESTLCLAFCVSALQKYFGKRVKRWMRPLYGYPSLLIFPVLFYILTQLIFGMPGTGFSSISYVMAVIVFASLPLLSLAVKKLYTETELRLEVHFLVSLFVCIIGLITTVNGNVTYAVVKEPLNVKALILAFGLFAVSFAIGFIWNRMKWEIFQKREKH